MAPYDFHLPMVYNVLWYTTSSTSRPKDGSQIGNQTIPTSPVLFVPKDLAPLLSIQVQGLGCLPECRQSNVLHLELKLEVPDVRDLGMNASVAKSEESWDISDLTVIPDVGQCSSSHFGYDQRRPVW